MPTHAQVTIHSTVPTATIDLQAGVATRYVQKPKTPQTEEFNPYTPITVVPNDYEE